MPFGYPGAANGNLNNLKGIGDDSEATITTNMNAIGASASFTWRVRKNVNY